MERRFRLLLLSFTLLLILSLFMSAVPVLGLSMIMGISVLGSSVLGSSMLGSSVLGTTTTIMVAYYDAITMSQLWVSLATIVLLVYVELTDPVYGRSQQFLLELRRSWTPISILLIVLFAVVVALKIWTVCVRASA